jgi:hypothetical protein
MRKESMSLTVIGLTSSVKGSLLYGPSLMERVKPSSAKLYHKTYPAGKPARMYITAINHIITPKISYITSKVIRMNIKK